MKPDMIATIRDLIQIREAINIDFLRSKQPGGIDNRLFSQEQRTAIIHLVNSYLDELLAPWTHGGKTE